MEIAAWRRVLCIGTVLCSAYRLHGTVHSLWFRHEKAGVQQAKNHG